MSKLPLFVLCFLCAHAADSYVMLTANVEDLQALAKEIAASPIIKQVKHLFRTAHDQFNRVSRAGDDEADGDNKYVVELGRKASKYLRTAVKYFRSNFYDEQ